MINMDVPQLISYLKNVEFSLFLGAGSSISGGGPTGSQLIDAIRNKYPEIEKEADFFSVFDKIISPDNAERAAVEEYIKSLSSLFTTKRIFQPFRTTC